MSISNKYEQNLLQNCSRLDAVTNCDGSISSCAKSILKGDKEKTRLLCKIVETVSERNNSKITTIAKAVKDSLVQYYGYLQLVEICSQKTICDDKELTLQQLMGQLDQLIGLGKVKTKVNDLVAFHKVQILRKEKGLRCPKGTMHLAFTGNPGTGKTTVARIIGRIYYKLGLLSKGHFMEVSRTDLIAGYQGQTALKVKNVIDKAKGGVLFIDEAYSITENDHSDSYGRECLTELTKALEDYRKDLVVIVAGYTEPMKKFFESNPGLRSRFNTFVEFDDYDATELLEILKSIIHAEDYVISYKAINLLTQLFALVIAADNHDFANGRFVRNLFESMIMNHARRINNINSPTMEVLKEITERDIPLEAYNIFDKDALKIIELERLEDKHFFEEYIITRPISNPQGLKDAEYGVMAMMLSNASSVIQHNLHTPNNASEYEKKLWSMLDSALSKYPAFQGKHLYRGELYCDISYYQSGAVFNHPFYLTTSEFEDVADSIAGKKFKWVITPSQNTKAVVLQSCFGEKQIEYPRNTSFKVVNKDEANKVLYVEEI